MQGLVGSTRDFANEIVKAQNEGVILQKFDNSLQTDSHGIWNY